MQSLLLVDETLRPYIEMKCESTISMHTLDVCMALQDSDKDCGRRFQNESLDVVFKAFEHWLCLQDACPYVVVQFYKMALSLRLRCEMSQTRGEPYRCEDVQTIDPNCL